MTLACRSEDAYMSASVATHPERDYPLAMSKTRTEVLEESRRKGIVAGATTAGAIAAGVVVAPFAGAVAAVPAAIFAYRWWRHRAENGIRF
jgi:hypothetical protein